MSENEIFENNEINVKKDKSIKALNGVSIASVVLSSIGMVLAIVAFVFLVISFAVGADDNPGAGIGIALNVIYMAIFAISSGAISVVSLVLGLVSLSKAKDNRDIKNKAIVGTVLSVGAIIICVLAFLLRI